MSGKNSKYNITGPMSTRKQIDEKTDEFLKLIQPIPQQLKEARKLIATELRKLRDEKKDVIKKLKDEVKNNKYKNK